MADRVLVAISRLKRDLYKSKEKYMAVASKMTKLETKLLSGK